jgi:hypothetical protein
MKQLIKQQVEESIGGIVMGFNGLIERVERPYQFKKGLGLRYYPESYTKYSEQALKNANAHAMFYAFESTSTEIEKSDTVWESIGSFSIENGVLSATKQGYQEVVLSITGLDENLNQISVGQIKRVPMREDVVLAYDIVESRTIRCIAGFRNVILKSTEAEYYDYPSDRIKCSGSVDKVMHINIYIDLEHLKIYLSEMGLYFWLRQEKPNGSNLEVKKEFGVKEDIERNKDNGALMLPAMIAKANSYILAKTPAAIKYDTKFEVKSFGIPIEGYEDIWQECEKKQIKLT